MNDIDIYRTHTVCSNPGHMAGWLASAPADLPSLRRLSTRIVFHYWANGDPLAQGFTPDRLPEVDLRYAEDQFARLAELTPGQPLTADRAQTQRILGCCRDFTLLLVSMLRERGVAARSRVGHAAYFDDGWFMDHVVAEVDVDGQWALVEAQVPDGFVGAGGPLDPLDVPRDRFLTGDVAWLAARDGRLGPDRFVVAPGLQIPGTRGWPQLAHNLVLDLAALTGWEAILWDSWGVLATGDPEGALRDPQILAALDRLATTVSAGAGVEELRELAADPLFAVPPTVSSHSPYDGQLRTVVRRDG